MDEQEVSLLIDEFPPEMPLLLDCMASRECFCLESLNMFEKPVGRF
jgi:hypothetical protein